MTKTSTEYTRARRARLRSHFALTGEVPHHNRDGYVIGCRCRTCRDAYRDYQTAYERERRARLRQERDLNADFDWEGDGS